MVVCCTLTSVATIQSQVPPPPQDEGSRRVVKQRVVLTQESVDAAKEYLDLVKELQELTRDYQLYLAKYERPAIDTMVRSLAVLQAKLAAGKLPSNPEALAEELAQQAALAEERSRYVKESTEIFPMQLYKLLRSLRRDLTGLESMVTDEVAPQLEELPDQMDKIRSFVAYSVSGEVQEVDTRDDGSQVYIFVVRPDAVAPVARTLDSLRAIEDALAQHRTIVVPAPPAPPTPPTRIWVSRPDESNYGDPRERTGQASFRVRDEQVPIVVRSTVGEIEIVPSADDQVSAEFSVSLSARSATQERTLMEQVSFRAIGNSRPCSVLVSIPTISGREAQLEHSMLRVAVPRSNPVWLRGSGGTISVSGLYGPVQIEAASAAIILSELRGPLTATNSRGSINGSTIRGPVTINMSHGPVSIAEAVAGMSIENAFGEISVSESRGPLSIRNQGSVMVNSHDGNLTVTNKFGIISVAEVRGTVDITNSNQMTTLSEITGAVTVDARYGGLTASSLQGSLHVMASHGSVNLESVTGPLTIQVDGGSIWAQLNKGMAGPSSITANGGSIWLSVAETSDLLIKAQSTGGSVQSELPAKMSNRAGATLAEIMTGSGRQILSVNSTGSSIHIASE